MKAPHSRHGRIRRSALTTLALIALPLLGGCSVSGGVNGSVGDGSDAGAHFGIDLEFGPYGGAGSVDTKQRYDGQTVYVVPDHRASP